ASHPRLLFVPARDDVGVGRARAAPRLVALRRLAPRRHGVVALPLAFAATHRVVDGVHHRTAHGRAKSLPAHAPSLADGDVVVVEVAALPDGGHALDRYQPNLARGQLERGALAFLGQELRLRAGAAADLRATAGVQLDVVHERPERDV